MRVGAIPEPPGKKYWLPQISADENTLVHLGAGIRYDDAKQGLRYSATPEVHDAPFFVDTGLFEADSSTLINLEASWRNGPLWIMTEFTKNDVKAPGVGDPSFGGYHFAASYSLTGEVRPYDRRGGVFGALPVARDINEGGFGAVELGLRWSVLDLTDQGIDGGQMEVAKAAVNWWATSTFFVSFNYHYIWNQVGDLNGRSDGVVIRLMIFTP